jgi:type VI secretion system FHA domain protein
VILTLEVAPPHATKLGPASRHTFRAEGGIIGRASNSDWVLPHTKVSGRHALIAYRDGVFYIEDSSTNGVFVNSSTDRLPRGVPHPLKSGDRLLIDPYDILVSIAPEPRDEARRPPPLAPSIPASGRSNPFEADDPFESSSFSSAPPIYPRSAVDPSDEAASSEELDPLKLLGGESKSKPVVRSAPNARDLDRSSPLEGHFQPPAVVPPSRPVVTPHPGAPLIPHDYDPLAPDDPSSILRRAVSAPPRFDTPAPGAHARTEPSPPPPPVAPPPIRPTPAAPPSFAPPAPPAAPPSSTPPPFEQAPPAPPSFAVAPPIAAPPPPQEAAAPAVREESAAAATPVTSDLASVLAGAGLDRADVTPQLANSFGRILRVVVSGVMDVLRSRQQIKDEFRMRMTHFRPADNNPLKFSANVDDALHNLLVKRNAAYLGPVEAFEDAFEDLRNHQIAMLAGMRVAFEFMLAEFDPDHLQETFDRQLKKGSSLLSVPAKLKYWDLYREMRDEMVKDPEASFRELFGEEFAKAYEEQLRRLKNKHKVDAGNT